jgi:hypothetical protein
LITVADGEARQRLFQNEFDDTFSVGAQEGNGAFFGLNVLRGLIDGIEDYIEERQTRWEGFRSLGTALLASSMWIDDTDLINKIGELSAACIVVSKQGRKPREVRKLQPLEGLNKRTPGMPVQAFLALTDLAPMQDGKPTVVGPSYSSAYKESIPTIRTLGFRKGRDNDSPPILHAKLALLGYLWWHDDDALGHIADVLGFEAQRLWISSANFTSSSRRNIEFGFWTEEPAT